MSVCSTWPCVWDWIERNATSIIALAALLTSLVVGGFTIWQVFVTRRHNRMSVRPLLDLHTERSFTPHTAGVWPVPGQGEVVIYLRNTGIGPAILKAYRLFVDKQSVPTDRLGPLEVTLAELLNRPMTHRLFTFSPPYSIRPQGDLQLLRLTTNCSSENEWGIVLAELERCQIEVDYESLYSETFVFKPKFAPALDPLES